MGDFIEELKNRNVIRVAIAYLAAAWLLIQFVETLFPVFGLSDALIRLVVIVLAIGFPLVLILSWLYELTPEGLVSDADVERSGTSIAPRGKGLDRAIIVTLALAIAYFALDKFVLEPARDSVREREIEERARSEALIDSFGNRSVAVLPFVNLSNDPGYEYFSDGISEELLNLLSQIPNLRVISRSSSFSFKDKDYDIPTVARQLNVAHILEGSVRKAGNQVRITAQLIDARSDTNLWSESYDRDLEDIFKIQDEISAAVVSVFESHLSLNVAEVPRTVASTSVEAHEAYLRGRFLDGQRTPSSVDGAISEFEKAIELDPEFALAYAGLASTLLLGYANVDQTEAETRAETLVERAMALDPTLAESQAAAGSLAWNQGDRKNALSHFEQAIRINPNYAEVYAWMAMILQYDLGRYEEAFAAAEIAVKLDPLSIPAISNFVWSLMLRNRFAEADRELEKLVAIAPGLHAWIRATRNSVGGNWASLALGNLDSLMIDPENTSRRMQLALYFALIGLEAEALAVQEPVQSTTMAILGKNADAVPIAEEYFAADPESSSAGIFLGITYAGAGDYARARPILEELWAERHENFEVPPSSDFVAALVAIRRHAGIDYDLDVLLSPVRENVRRMREAGMTTVTWLESADYDSGLADYLAGDRDRGLELIARAANDGFFIFPDEAYLKELYDDPGFAPIIESQRVRQIRERKRFLGIVCNSSPYTGLWEPEELTCEQFAAEGEY